ncbi:hypothetical protein [Priestia megaterium]|uniref:Uncharacterized protein n=1 Tax=Priestia megaterium TaxID=1404 RepID=A0A6M6E421_PRIMG|nr:hypothetical protein [Priestia megaterium]QJX80426.1 hypothetical protein FDZ14_30530 [Priestia megaterium]
MNKVLEEKEQDHLERIYNTEFENTLEKLITAFAAEKGNFNLNEFFLNGYTEVLRNSVLSRVAEATSNEVNLLDSYSKNEKKTCFEDEEFKFNIILKQIDLKIREISDEVPLNSEYLKDFRSKSHWRLLELIHFILEQMSKSTLELIRFECHPYLINNIQTDKEKYYKDKFTPGTTFLYGDINCKRAKLKLVYNPSSQKYNLLNLEDHILLFREDVNIDIVLEDPLLTPYFE